MKNKKKSPGPISDWVEKRHKNNLLPLHSALTEYMSKELTANLYNRLQRRVIPQFGLSSAEELAVNEVDDLLHRLSLPGTYLPSRVTDTKSLCDWIFWRAWKRLCDEIDRHKSGPSPKGHSGTPAAEDGSGDRLGMEGFESKQHKGFEVDFDAIELEQAEAFNAARSDFHRWSVYADRPEIKRGKRDWVYCFEEVYLSRRKVKDVAAELSREEDTIRQFLNRGKFCMARQWHSPKDVLVKEFGESEVIGWTLQLKEALKQA